MPQNFIGSRGEQGFLLPPDVRDWVPPDHLAWFVIDAVMEMKLGAFYGAYRADGHGRAAYDPSMMGWIQLVVATPDVEELRCREEALLLIVPLRQGSVARDVRLPGAGNMWSGSGRRSLEGRRANGRPSRLVSCRALVSGGFARVAGCRPSILRRCRGAICRSPSGRRSRSCSRVVVGCERSPVSSVAQHQPSPGSCSEMLRCGPVGLSIEPRPPRLMPTDAPDDQSRRSSRSTRSCGPMCKPGSPGLCGGPMGASRARWSAGVGGVTDREKTGAGDNAGARSRSPVG